VELHGKNPQQIVIAIIPARYSSVRLPGKMLLEIAGKPLIVHTLEQAKKARSVDRVIVATDDERILNVVKDAGGEAVMTRADHASGSDRIAEVAQNLPEGSIIVNVQGDEPLISPDTIDRAVEALLIDGTADIATTCEPIESLWDLLNGNNVKVVVGDAGYALYFSRSPMPWPREASLRYDGDPNQAIEEEPELLSNFRKHTGLYVYRREYLLKFTKLPQTQLEKFEMLEQLRALEDGAKIRVVESAGRSIGVDTDNDLERVRILIEELPVTYREGGKNDIPDVARIYVESVRRSFECVYPQDYLDGLTVERREEVVGERFAEPEYRLHVAESATGKMIGFVESGMPVLDGVSSERQIISIYLLPEFQRLGVGKGLFDVCVSKLVEDRVSTLCLDTVKTSPFRRFYEKLGGKAVGEGSHRFGDDDMATVIYYWDDLSKL
jgi:3-deoxy-manno-octulosonate cytidylyltransferase (CMP-KDO synthetase)